jgi:lipoprotein-anchoring transpeptidase ErfK/SrfK
VAAVTHRLRNGIAIGAAIMVAPIVSLPGYANALPAHEGTAHSPSATAATAPTASKAPRHHMVATFSLSTLGRISRYAFVERPTVVRSAPVSSAHIVGRLRTITFWSTSTVVLALAGTAGPPRTSWTEIRLSQLPNNATGWVPTRALSPLHAVHTWLKIDRQRLTATLIRDGHPVFSAPVGVGQPQWPTPAGQFFIEESLSPPEPSGLYGPLAFGTSAHSAVLTEWPNAGQIGIHGTNEPQLIPGRISHGCIRLHNPDILRLSRLMPVGTPVTIV